MKTFNKGDSIVCRDPGSLSRLTVGKTYVVDRTNTGGDEVYLTDDGDRGGWYFARRFELVSVSGSMTLAESIEFAQSLIGKAFNSPKHGGRNVIAEKVVVYLPGHDFSKYGSVNAQTELGERGFSVCVNTKNSMEYPVSSIELAPVSETIKLTSDYDAIIYADRVEVGCQTIPKAVLQELWEKMQKLG